MTSQEAMISSMGLMATKPLEARAFQPCCFSVVLKGALRRSFQAYIHALKPGRQTGTKNLSFQVPSSDAAKVNTMWLDSHKDTSHRSPLL